MNTPSMLQSHQNKAIFSQGCTARSWAERIGDASQSLDTANALLMRGSHSERIWLQLRGALGNVTLAIFASP